MKTSVDQETTVTRHARIKDSTSSNQLDALHPAPEPPPNQAPSAHEAASVAEEATA